MNTFFATLAYVFIGSVSASAASSEYQSADDFYARAAQSLMHGGTLAKVQDSLEAQFKEVCDDSFCEGEYGNLKSLGLSCSINAAEDRVGQCVWTFVGLYRDVDRVSGKITDHQKTTRCDLNFVGSSERLADFLTLAAEKGTSNVSGLIDAPIPGNGKTLFELLQGCLL